MGEASRVLLHPFYYLPERWNGMDEHMLLLARRLDRERYSVAVLQQDGDGPQSATLAQRAAIDLVAAPFPAAGNGPNRCLALARLLRETRTRVLHIHSPAAGGQFWPALAARLAGAEVVATYHQVQPRLLPARTRFLNRLTHRVLIGRTLAVSRDVRATLEEYAGVPASQVQIIANGIEPDAHECPRALPLRRNEVRAGFFGRLSPEKGVEQLLNALARLREDSPDLHLYLAGEGPQRAELETLALRLGVQGRVTFLGYRPDARALMAEMDLVVHVPEYEGFGLVLLEGMAAGKPLIVNDARGGMTELVQDGINGTVVPAGDVEALAAAIRRLAADPAERARLGANGLRICNKSYSAASFAAKVSRVYDDLLAGKR